MKIREIKFRAWDAEHKQFNQVVAANILHQLHDGDVDPEYGTRFFLQQFTGLRDRRGIEIYEGDIVCYRYTGGDRLDKIVKSAEVKWGVYNIGCNGFEYDNYINGPYVEDEYMYSLMIEQEYIEVIGNIYQNPELL